MASSSSSVSSVALRKLDNWDEDYEGYMDFCNCELNAAKGVRSWSPKNPGWRSYASPIYHRKVTDLGDARNGIGSPRMRLKDQAEGGMQQVQGLEKQIKDLRNELELIKHKVVKLGRWKQYEQFAIVIILIWVFLF